MELSAIDIDAVPLLDTMVGMFGSFGQSSTTSDQGVFEVAVTVMLVMYD